MSSFFKCATELALRVDAEYKATSYDINAFAKIAFDCIQQSGITYDVSDRELLAYQLKSLPLLADNKENFSDFPVILFSNCHFIVQALHWYNASTSIHEHGFTGAFKVLRGSSIETQFTFQERESVDETVQLGELKKSKISHLKEGDISLINGGKAYIHSLFHLESPSITLIVRTHKHAAFSPQRNFYGGSIATDYFRSINETRKLITIFQVDAGRLMPPNHAFFELLVEQLGLNQVIELLLDYNVGVKDPMVQVITNKYGSAVAEQLLTSIQSEKVKRQLMLWREHISDFTTRAVLATVLNASNRRECNDLLNKILPDENPDALLANAIQRLIESQVISFSVSGEPLKGMLTFALSSYTLDEFVGQFYEEFDEYSVNAQMPKISSFWYKLTTIPPLKVIWTN